MKNFIARIRGDNSRGNVGKKLQYYATDVDYALIVVTPTQPTFSYLILDKYLVLCEYGDVTPLIVVNKADLAKNETDPDLEYYQTRLAIEVVKTSTYEPNNTGIQTLKEHIFNKSCVLLGKSGVGKSSLVNALDETQDVETGNTSEKYGEGKHTTTGTTKYQLAENTWLIDTPGLRNIDVSNISAELLKELFPDFVAHAAGCKFNNCMHLKENNCGVKKALESGEILESRYESYLKMQSD